MLKMNLRTPCSCYVLSEGLVLVCYRNYRYPGCTTRTSVPSQPTALQKPSYKKNRIYKIKTPTPPPSPTQPNPTQKKKTYQLAKAKNKLQNKNIKILNYYYIF